jgi:hypothetical protein
MVVVAQLGMQVQAGEAVGEMLAVVLKLLRVVVVLAAVEYITDFLADLLAVAV